MNNNNVSNDVRDGTPFRRRQHPRIRPNIPIPVRLPDGTVRNDLVLDISRGGLRIQCDREVAVIIHPGGGRLVPDNPQVIELELHYPVGGKEALVTVSCKLCYIKGTVEGAIDIGMEYVEFKGDSFEHFQRFLEEPLMPV